MQVHPTSLAVCRILSGFSQARLSRVSKVSQGHISGIEAGEKQASPEMLVRLADAMGVPVAALITDPTPEQVAEARQKLSKRVPLSKAIETPAERLARIQRRAS